MKIRTVAESIVNGLDKLHNNSTTIDKINHSYKDIQIEIVLNHLREMMLFLETEKG